MDSINIRTLLYIHKVIVYTQRMYIEYRKKKASYRNRTDDHRITNAML